jgi:uncharacterized protein YegJ (DUF2314 family)
VMNKIKQIESILCVLLFSLILITSWNSAQCAGITTELKDSVISGDAQALEAFIAPYVAMARETLPEAIERFENGLPPKHQFSVTTRIYDEHGNWEQIFVLVKKIKKGVITGRIISNIGRVPGYHYGDRIKVKIEDIYDWTIVLPNGKEEGNYVGKMLDVLKERKIALVMEIQVNEEGKVIGSKFLFAITPSQQDVTFCIPQPIIEEAESIALGFQYDPEGHKKTAYTYVVYDFLEEKIERNTKE